MVFASLSFLYLFLPLNLILYYASNNAVYRNAILTIFSFVFYAWGEPVWVLLLVFSATVDYLNARFIDKYRGTPWAKFGVVSTVFFNAGILCVFKYGQFFIQNFNGTFNTHLHLPYFSLPIGISFYTFQTISYVIDVYRGEVPAQKSWFKFMMFVSLYHQLVAGPIVRYSHIVREIDNRKVNIGDISAGIGRFCIGLFKKVCIANVAGELVKKYMDGDLQQLSVGGAWFGVIMFTIQIYFDFSGYSDMAIGLGRMFGFHYHENFNYPYIATSATEFWRRWHISLGTFFRDYLYIPLGGNRRGTKGTWIIFAIFITLATGICTLFALTNNNWLPMKIEGAVLVVLLLPALFSKDKKTAIAGSVNLFFIWFVTGMWHGASWNFILWGLYFGFLIFIERLFLMRILQGIPKIFGHVYLLFAAIIGWALFYFTNFSRLLKYLSIMFSNGFGWHVAAFLLFFCIVYSLLTAWPFVRKRLSRGPRLARYAYHFLCASVTTRLSILVYILVIKPFLDSKLGPGLIPKWDLVIDLDLQENIFWLALAVILCLPVFHLFNRWIRHGIVRKERSYLILVSMALNVGLIFIATALLVGKSYNPFIYYRF